MFLENSESLCQNLRGLIENEPDALANLSNSAALLFHSLDRINWAGFYLYKENQLVLDLKPILGNNSTLKSVEIREDYLELMVKWSLF